MKKKLLLIMMLLSVTLTSAQLSAGTTFNDGLLNYSVTTLADPGSPNTVTVTGFLSGATIPAALIIPATVTEGGIIYDVTLIGINAFKGKTTITSLVVDGDTTIDSQSFANCSGLTTVNLPNVTKIGPSPSVGLSFWNCSNLQSINIPVIQSISTGAFNGCSALSSITFPASLTSLSEINYNMFKGCSNLTNITVQYDTFIALGYNPVTSVNTSIFADVVSNASVVLTVPFGKKTPDYTTGDVWKDFSTIVEAPALSIKTHGAKTFEAYPNPVTNNLYFSSNDVDSVEIYNILGSKVSSQKVNNGVNTSSLSKGVYVVKCQNDKGVAIGILKMVKE
ncbi:leucine-rich repeat protein [Flavobacterium algicola]|uniref:leucine-rich repeat protein n=1 Tax=Flavobacterium algicola TaxID=556529 RepID=UPI001EFC5AAF|nr:leucine-rich repeat protein [Flavobacterium algicola]MCG9792311.1 leucine-rich repeat protein [Flavobacterium algicola]